MSFHRKEKGNPTVVQDLLLIFQSEMTDFQEYMGEQLGKFTMLKYTF